MNRSTTLPLESHPIATFVVERDPAKGYRVASREGQEADAFADAALSVLDVIGQPDPRGQQVTFRWLGPMGPSKCYVAVWVTMLPSGEARYQQAWYRPTKTPTGSAWMLPLFSVAIAAAAFAVGMLVQRRSEAPVEQMPPIHEPERVQLQVPEQPNLREVAGPLIAAIADADNAVTVLEQFLGQEGIAAPMDDAGNRSGPEKERVVTLTASQEFGPKVPSEKKTFSNYEAAKLLALFRRLRDFVEAVERSAPAKSLDVMPDARP